MTGFDNDGEGKTTDGVSNGFVDTTTAVLGKLMPFSTCFLARQLGKRKFCSLGQQLLVNYFGAVFFRQVLAGEIPFPFAVTNRKEID